VKIPSSLMLLAFHRLSVTLSSLFFSQGISSNEFFNRLHELSEPIIAGEKGEGDQGRPAPSLATVSHT